MATRFGNRLLTMSLVLAAAGALACIASLLEVLLPHGTVVAFFGWLLAAGLAIAAVMIAFVLTCDNLPPCESLTTLGRPSPRPACPATKGLDNLGALGGAAESPLLLYQPIQCASHAALDHPALQRAAG
jgi:hypothetical protein